jgi:hypothetical protein
MSALPLGRVLAVSKRRRVPLSRLFTALNHHFWNDTLPPLRVRYFRIYHPKYSELNRWMNREIRLRVRRQWRAEGIPLPPKAPPSPRLLGVCHADREIRIQPRLWPWQTRRVLLHEMAHAATPGAGHGPAWQAEMRRLAALGETWAALEASETPEQEAEQKRANEAYHQAHMRWIKLRDRARGGTR